MLDNWHLAMSLFRDNKPTVLENGTTIWPDTSIGIGENGSANIGADCTIGRGVHIGKRVTVGAGCKIQNGAQLFEGVELADHVFIGPHAVFTNVVNPRAFVSRRAEFKPTQVGRGATIGANATIRCGVNIGPFAMIGAGAVVTKDVPMYAVMVGVPAKRVGWACSCGEPIAKHHGILRYEPRECRRCCMSYDVSSNELVVAPREDVVHRTPGFKEPLPHCRDVLRAADCTCPLCAQPYSEHPYCAHSRTPAADDTLSSAHPGYDVHVTCDGLHVKL